MEKALRIKSKNWAAQIALPILILTCAALALFNIINETPFRAAAAAILISAALLHLVFLMRTRNFNYIIPAGFYIFAGLTFIAANLHKSFLSASFSSIALVLFILFIYILAAKKIKWRYREVMELAARSVHDTEDGFTSRPFPAEKTESTKTETISFARFLLKHAIAFPMIKKDKVIIVIPQNMMLYFFGIRKEYQKDSHIIYNYNGNITVSITEKDYRSYNEELTFDKLCSSFSELFLLFLEQHKNKQEDKIIKRLNELKFVM